MKRNLLALALGSALAATAPAVLNLNLTGNFGTVPSSGGSLTLVGTLTGLSTDPSTSDITSTVPSGLTLNLDPAFVAYLDGASLATYSGNIATVTIAPGTAPGIYSGQIAASDSSFPGFVDSEAFVVSVQAVPEPAAFATMGIGLLAVIRRRRR